MTNDLPVLPPNPTIDLLWQSYQREVLPSAMLSAAQLAALRGTFYAGAASLLAIIGVTAVAGDDGDLTDVLIAINDELQAYAQKERET